MKRILIVCSEFPPVNSVAARRPAAFAKYLTRLSWDATVLTGMPGIEPGRLPQDPVWQEQLGIPAERIVRVSAKPFAWSNNGLLTRARCVAQMAFLPGSSDHDLGRAMRKAIEKLPRDIGIILATFPGAAPFQAASFLAKSLGVPWIADFRDTPDQRMGAPRWFRELVFRRLVKIARSASAWIAVTGHMAEELARRTGRPVTVIPNGYDPEILPPAATLRRDVFRIVYTGTITSTQDINPVVRAAEELCDGGQIPRGEIRIDLYGPSEAVVAERFRQCAAPIVHVHKWLPAEECMRRQSEATALVVLALRGFDGIYSGKIFEYMAAGRPVLAYPCDRSGVDTVLRSTGIGVSCDSDEEIKAVLLRWYRQWKETGDVAICRKSEEIAKFDRANQTRMLASICEDIVRGELREVVAAHARDSKGVPS